MLIHSRLALLLALLGSMFLQASGLELTYASHFQQWYPQFREEFQNAMRYNCSAEYQKYVESTDKKHPEAYASAIVACLYQSKFLNDGIKSNFASATVLLGFLPTSLSIFGSSAAEASLVSLRRPLLALLLSFGSPAPSPIRPFEYYNPIEILGTRRNGLGISSRMSSLKKKVIVTIQLLAVMASIANTMDLALDLGYRTVSSWAPSRTWTVLLWTFLGVAVHVFACIILRLRVTVNTGIETPLMEEPRLVRYRAALSLPRMRQNAIEEFSPCFSHSPTELLWKKEGHAFIFLNWFTSVGTALQIVYGTLTFSGLMFISVQDSTIVVARYFLSAIVCRLILIFELYGINEASSRHEVSRWEEANKDTELIHLRGASSSQSLTTRESSKGLIYRHTIM